MGRTSDYMNEVTEYELALRDSKNVFIYTTYECLRDLLYTLRQRPTIRHMIKRITVISDIFLENEYGYHWGWEQVSNEAQLDADYSNGDMRVLFEANSAHAEEADRNLRFVTSGEYRKMLTEVFHLLPDVREISIGRLARAEQIPGWDGPEIIKDLTFYKPGLKTAKIWYGKYSYDMVTGEMEVLDPFGIDEPIHLHPHITFFDDFEEARYAAGMTSKSIRVHRYEDTHLSAGYESLRNVACTCKFSETPRSVPPTNTFSRALPLL